MYLIFLKLGKLLRPKNIRNTKTKNKNNYTLKNKVILKQRINIEHKISIFKQYNRLYKRNDRYISPFINFIYLTSLILLDKLRVRRTLQGPKGPVNIIDNYVINIDNVL